MRIRRTLADGRTAALLDGLLDLLEVQVGLGPSRLRTEEHVKLLEYPLFFNNI